MLDFGDPLGTSPKAEKTCPAPISTIMQNFTPIGVTVAETVTTQKNIHNKAKQTIGAYAYDKTQATSVAFVV